MGCAHQIIKLTAPFFDNLTPCQRHNLSLRRAGRLTNVTYADGKQDSFTYDAVGNLLTYANESVSATLTYDALNRKLSEAVDYGPFSKTYSYTYDARGNKASYTSPEGVVYSYAYNLNNQPTGISFDGNTIALNYQWNRLVSSTLPNGVTTDYQYNANSWLTYITTEQGTSTLSDYNYGFDNVGNITNKNTEHGNYSYSYDSTYQLTNAVSPSLQEPFTYDNTGNRLTDSTASTNLPFGTTEYLYNSRNRLETVNLPDGRTATYAYDPFGRRIKKDVAGQVTYYAYSDEGLIGEYSQSGNPQKAYGWRPDSIWGTGPVLMVDNGNYNFYHNDTLGAPQKLTDENGNTVWSATYSVFGVASVDPSSTVENNLRFPGQYYDEETGLHYNDARYYNPQTGRYTQTDPYGLLADINSYRYAWNSPAMVIDPQGEVGLVGVGIGAAIGGVSGYFYTGTVQGALGGAVIGGTAGFFGQYGTSLRAGILIGTLVGAGENIAGQMIIEGKNSSCLDWNEVGSSAILGGVTGGIGKKVWSNATNLAEPKRIYSARVLARGAEEPGPFHNFPMSFDEAILKTEPVINRPNYKQYELLGGLNDYKGVYEIGVKPSPFGRIQVIVHRFFRRIGNE